MNPPTVRTLDQLVNETNAVYDPRRANIQGQITTANSRLGEAETVLGKQQENAFGDITQASARRGALFSGFTPDQQARYTSEKYLPALANLRAANEQTVQGLNTASLGLDAEQRKSALDTREGDLSKLYDYNKTQEDRKFQTDQANIAYEREMNRLREEQAFAAKENAKSQAASSAKSSTPSPAQFLVSAFSGYDHKKANGYTEKEVIPSLMANFGLSQAEAAQLAYQYRKNVFKV